MSRHFGARRPSQRTKWCGEAFNGQVELGVAVLERLGADSQRSRVSSELGSVWLGESVLVSPVTEWICTARRCLAALRAAAAAMSGASRPGEEGEAAVERQCLVWRVFALHGWLFAEWFGSLGWTGNRWS